jgi:hypothetical protein
MLHGGTAAEDNVSFAFEGRMIRGGAGLGHREENQIVLAKDEHGKTLFFPVFAAGEGDCQEFEDSVGSLKNYENSPVLDIVRFALDSLLHCYFYAKQHFKRGRDK